MIAAVNHYYRPTLTIGEDEKGKYLSYWDIWDFDVRRLKLQEIIEFVGKPFEIYNRIYFKDNEKLSALLY
jgi:hypothetical protein